MDENICMNCEGNRKVINPVTQEEIPCNTCCGDGSNSGIIGDVAIQINTVHKIV